MTTSLLRHKPTLLSRLIRFGVWASLLIVLGGMPATIRAANPNKVPVLLSETTSTRAIAFESVTMRPEPFPVTSTVQFSPDTRTRVAIFAMNLELLAGESASAFSADAEDAARTIYPMKVEYVGQVPGFPGISMIIVRFNDTMGDLGDVLVRLSLHGVASNRVRLAIGHTDPPGGAPFDVGAVPTPAPQTPPPADLLANPNPYTDPAFASGNDGIRFLEQATWGPSDADLNYVRQNGYASWLAQQFSTPPLFAATQSNYPTPDNYPTVSSVGCPTGSLPTCGRDHYTMYPLQIQFFQNALTRPDQLRQRVAFAFHQLIPVSGFDLNNQPAWVAPTLQVFDRNAFGNFRTILMDVTLNAGMGEYLNMRGNTRVNPNENYAREVMQLFSVGVDLLNQDGTPVLDAQGNHVPTYTQADITNFARVFTGWVTAPNKLWVVDGVTGVPNYTDPMVLQNNFNGTYDIGQKTILNGTVLPACTNCTTLANAQTYKNNELNLAIDNLFNHQNTAPYVCTQLIHHLVTSNPSPAYVGRCSAAFNSNRTSPVQMQEVIKAILFDLEARGDSKNSPSYGHLREPLMFATNLLRTFNATSDGNISSNGTRSGLITEMGQNLFNPPTVFSYFPADFILPGTVLFGPEFGILDTSTTYKRANFVNTLFLANSGNGLPASPPDRPTGTQLNYAAYQNLAGNAQQLVDALEARMTHGSMSSTAKTTIVGSVNGIAANDPAGRTRAAIYLIATSSQYQVEK